MRKGCRYIINFEAVLKTLDPLKPCSHLRSVFAFASKFRNGFYGNERCVHT